ncbi:MAG: peptidylprolyl isomerase [Bacilli bacterium]
MENPVVTIKFNVGEIKLELFNDVPNSTNNFLNLANEGFYDGLKMHRVIPGFVAQGGCPLGTGTGGPGYSIDGEFLSNGFNNPHQHNRGVIAWARSAARNSAGSQFYITLENTPHLNNDYAVFGRAIDGLEILDIFDEYGSSTGICTKEIIIENVSIDLKGNVLNPVIKVK